MNTQPDGDYFSEAKSWAIESDRAVKQSARLAWIIAGCAVAVAIVQGLALIFLLPLKEKETVMLLVDRTTGYVQEIDPASSTRIRADDALLQSLLAQYVTAREGYDRSNLQAAYRKAALWSSGTARQNYLNRMSRQSSANPANFLRSEDSISVEVKSVSQVNPGSALVRFDTLLETNSGRILRDGSWIALVDYQFSNAPMSYEDRLLNPLGLQVTGYRRDAERPIDEAAVLPESLRNEAAEVTP